METAYVHHLPANPEKKRLMAGKTSGLCALTKRRKACWLYLSPSSAFSSTALCRLLLLTLNKRAKEKRGSVNLNHVCIVCAGAKGKCSMIDLVVLTSTDLTSGLRKTFLVSWKTHIPVTSDMAPISG